MPDIFDLDAVSSFTWDGNDVIPIVRVSDTEESPEGSTRKLTLAQTFTDPVVTGTLTVNPTLSVLGNATVSGSLNVTGTAGFNNAGPQAKPTVTGAKGGNAALASLLTALAAYGLITDSTSA